MVYLQKRLKEIDDIGAYNVNGRKEKFTEQLIEQGFHDGDTFDLFSHLTELILPRLIRFKELAEKCIVIDFPLDEMIKAFVILSQDKIAYSEQENKDIKTGLTAFAEYYRALWW